MKRNRPFGKREKDATQIAVQNELKDDPTCITNDMLERMEWWNKHATKTISDLKSSPLNTNRKSLVKALTADDFILEMLMNDITLKCVMHDNNTRNMQKDRPTYTCGRTRSHVWVAKNEERIFMFYCPDSSN